jgi:hypothetical protein
MKLLRKKTLITSTVALLALTIGAPSVASHRVILFNEKAMEKVLDMWPDFVIAVNNQARGVDDPGGRGIILQSPLRAHLNQLLREQPTPQQYGFGFKQLVSEYYHRAGMTTFGSRLNTKDQVTAYNYLLRKDGKLPIRFAYSFDLARQPMATVSAAAFYGQVKEILETCPDFNAATVQALMRGLRAGWRFAGVHGVGSKALRIFVEQLEEQMRRNPGLLTPEYVQDMRNGFAHGTLTGALPDVSAQLVKYNLYLPVQSVSAGQRPPLACDRADQHRAALRRAGLRVSRTRKDVNRSGRQRCW